MNLFPHLSYLFGVPTYIGYLAKSEQICKFEVYAFTLRDLLEAA